MENDPVSRIGDLESELERLQSLRERGLLNDEEFAEQRRVLLAQPPASGGPPAAVPVAPEQSRSVAGGLLKWGGVGCLGLLLLIGILLMGSVVVVLVVVANLGDDEPDSGGDVRVLLREGTSGEIAPEGNGSRRSRVTIVEVVDSAPDNNPIVNPPEGKRFWAAMVRVENAGDREVRAIDWALRDSLGVESQRAVFHDAGENLPFDYRLTPGGRVEGWVVFAIDTDARPVWLRADPDRILAHDLYFDAP